MGLPALTADLRLLIWEEKDFNWSETDLFQEGMGFFQGILLQLYLATGS